MEYKYGEFTKEQLEAFKEAMRKKIFFLLVIVDPETKDKYAKIDVSKAFTDILLYIGGLNSIFVSSPELIQVSGLIQSALDNYQSDDFDFNIYRKLILDAGSIVLKIEE